MIFLSKQYKKPMLGIGFRETLDLINCSPKREEANTCHLYTLHRKRDAYNGQTQDKGRAEMHESQLPAQKQNPNNIKQKTPQSLANFNLFPKGKQAKASNFKALQTERNTDNCQTEH